MNAVALRLGLIAGFSLALAGSLLAQDKPETPAAPKDATQHWFLLTGPKQVTSTPATSTPHLCSALTITDSPPGGTLKVPYNFQFTATGASLGVAYQWSYNTDIGLPPGLQLATSGMLSGTPTKPGTYSIQVFVTDAQFDFGSGSFMITIAQSCTPNFLTGSQLTNGDVNAQYSQAITVGGCAQPYTFTLASTPFGASVLPPGLGIANPPAGSSSAKISGTPTTASQTPYSFNIMVTEANGGSAVATFSITIDPQLTIAAASPLPSATVGLQYSQPLSPSGGTTPYFSITLDKPPPGMTLDSPSGVLHGTPPQGSASSVPYSFTATLTDNIEVVVNKAFQLTIAAAPVLLQVSPTSLNFSAVAGGAAPANQALSLAPTAAATSGATFRVLIDGGQLNTKPSFSLSVKPTSGSAPAQLVVSVDQAGLQAGNTSGRIRILDQFNNETDIPVNLAVTAVNSQLQVAPAVLRFSASTQSPGTFEQDLAVTSTGGGGSVGFNAASVNGSSWISSVTAESAQTARNSAVFVRVLVNTQGKHVGSYSDTIRVKFSGGSVDVPISLFVRNGGPVVGVNVTGLRYQAQQGGGFSNTQTVKILDLGDSSTTVNWNAKIVTGSDTVSLGATSGTATTTKPGSLPINLATGATGLAPGGHYALISITDPNSQNSPAYIVVVLDLAASGSPALPDPNPAGLFFVVVAGGPQSANQTVTVNTSSAQAVPFQVAASTADGGGWLSLNPASGQTSGQTAGTFAASVIPASMAAGVYSGQASVSINGAVRTVNVTMVVLPAGSTIPTSALEPAEPRTTLEEPRAAGCTPGKLALTETGLVNNFSVPAKWPATLIVQLNDDCANAVANGAAVASFSNGDVPVSLVNNGQGASYSATWQPSSTSSQMLVTLNATAGTLTPASLQLNGGVASNQAAAPVLTTGGTVNAFYRVSGGPLSPGTIVEMYGSGLASSATGTGAPPLPLAFNGTSVLVGGLSAPLFYVSDGQLDVEIPSELAATQQYPILVLVNGAVALPDQLDIVALQPSVDVLTDGTLVAQHGADFSLVTTSKPAKPGELLVIYLLGMGPTDPSVASGAAAPSNPLAQVTAQPTITVDGNSASVYFAGLAPGFSGLYQVDFYVPTNARSGNLTVVISQNGVPTNTTALPVSQ